MDKGISDVKVWYALFFYDFSEGIPIYSRYLNISDGNIPPL